MLENRSAESLRERLDEVPDGKPSLRLVVALNYKHDVSVPKIASMYGIPERTVYNWLHRLESGPLENAIYDEMRPGRPPKLTPSERSELESALGNSPRSVGVPSSEWTVALVSEYLEEEFDVEFSLRHIRRLSNEPGGE